MVARRSARLCFACLAAVTALSGEPVRAQTQPTAAPNAPPASAPAPAPPSAATPTAEPPPTAAAAAEEPPIEVQQQYRLIVEHAVVEFDAGRFAEARALFLRAHEMWPSARTFRVLGMTSFELRNYVSALRALTAALADARRPLSDEHRREVEALIEQTRVFVGRYRLELTPATARLRVDGNAAQREIDGSLLLGVGHHELLASADGHAPLRRQLFVEGRDDRTLVLELVPLSASPPPAASTEDRPAAPPPAQPAAPAAVTADPSPRDSGFELWPWMLGAGGAIGATALVLFISAEVEDDCKPMCANGQVDSIRLKEKIYWTSAAVSAGLLVTGTVLFFSRESAKAEQGAFTARFEVGAGYVGTRGRF
jgi:hypothetical protein